MSKNIDLDNTNTKIIENILNDDEIELLLNHETVLKNKSLIENNNNNNNNNNNAKFTIPINNNMIDRLNNKFNCNLNYNQEIPFRWVKGNTPAHTDKSIEGIHFNTHLVYLTDNNGKLKIENNEYSIKKGCGYMFKAGLMHETINTEDSLKLILGPFNNKGNVVGVIGNLTSLTLSSGTLSPSFDINTYSYTVNVPYNISNIDISFTTSNSIESYNINGVNECQPTSLNGTYSFNSNLVIGNNPISIDLYTLFPCTNLASTYNITITRDSPPPKPLYMGIIFSNNSLVYYKSHSLSTGSGGSGVRNYRNKQRRT